MRTFERRNDGLGLTNRGIVGTAIGIAGAVLVVWIANKCGRHMQRWHNRPRDGLDGTECLRSQGAGLPGGRGHCDLRNGTSHYVMDICTGYAMASRVTQC